MQEEIKASWGQEHPGRAARWLTAAALTLAIGVAPVMAQPRVPAAAASAASAKSDELPPAVVAAVRASVEAWTRGNVRIDDVRRTSMSNLLEVRIGNDIVYVDEKAQFILVQGELIDMKSRRNLTRDRLDEVLAIDFDSLPLDLAFKQVVGNGKRRFAVFEDPNCGYCRKLRADLVKLDNVTIHTFVYSILGGDSELKSRKVLCAADKVRAWNELMISNKIPGNSGTCDTPLEKIRAFGSKHALSSTPTTFFANGRRLQGYVAAAEFERLLNEYSAK